MSNLVKRTAVIAGAVALLSIAAPAALAQSSLRGYDGEAPLGQAEDIAPVQQTGGEGSPPAGQVVSGVAGDNANGSDGSLPFTGWDLGIVLMLGLALAGTGLVVRRAARSSSG
ncbi:MAG: hypothetical protein ACRDL4_02335 [Thermoleophilaceae bacterium]